MSDTPVPATPAGGSSGTSSGVWVTPWVPGTLIGVSLLLFEVLVSWGTATNENLLWVSPMAIALAGPSLFVGAVLSDPRRIWSPLSWFHIAYGVYFGVGALAPYLGAVEARIYLFPGAWPDPEVFVQLNVLNLVGWTLVNGAAWGASVALSRYRRPISFEFNDRDLVRLFWFFLIVGFSVKILRVLPLTFGISTDVVPGAVMAFSNMAGAAIVIAGRQTTRSPARWGWFLGGILSVEIAVGVVMFSKSEVMVALVCAFLGLMMGKPTLKVVLLAGVAGLLVYSALSELVAFGRQRINDETGTHYQAGWGRRAEIVDEYLSKVGTGYDPMQKSWLRLCYSDAQVFAMEEYSVGRPGYSMQEAAYSVVPRAIWPGKPVMTDVGSRFNELYTGNPNSQSSPGVFAEAYWNGSWVLVIASGLWIGTWLVLLETLIFSSFAQGKAWVIPCALICIRMGGRPDGWLVPDYVGTLPLIVGMYTVTYLVFYNYLSSSGRPAIEGR